MKKLIGEDAYLKDFIEAVPSPLFVLNKKMEILSFNKTGSMMVGPDAEKLLMQLCGEVLHCLHEHESVDGCGTTDYCNECALNNAVADVWKGKRTLRKKYKFKIQKNGVTMAQYLYVSASPFEYDNELYSILILEDQTELEEIRQIVPICSFCKNIRTDDNYWNSVDSYFNKYSGTRFSHGICPECAKKHYPDLKKYNK